MDKQKTGHTKDMKDAQKARLNWYRYNAAYTTGHDNWVTNATKYDRFYSGEQWDEKDKRRLEAEGRPALTLNMVLSTINAMIGEQLERKVEVTWKPGKLGTENTAFALNAVTKSILNANHYDDIEEIVYADGLITDRGYFDVRMEFQKNMQGDVVITHEDPICVIPDPEAKEADPKTWNEVFIERWQSPDEIEELYGSDKASLIRRMAANNSFNRSENFDYYSQTFGGEMAADTYDGEEVRRLKRVRVIERQHYQMATQYYFVNMETGDMRPIPYDADEEELKQIAEEKGLGLHKGRGRRVRQTISCDDVLLYDDWSIYRSFTIVPYFPYFRRGRPFGVVKNLLDPQNLLNKTSSQELHIVNTTANSGWIVQEDSLVDMDQEDLEERGAETGLVLTYKRGYEKPEKIKPNQIPTGIERISQKAAVTIREISAINASMVGAARADQSGKAQEMSIGRSQVQVSVVLNNLKRARRWVAEKVLELVQDFYTETRYFDIVDQAMFGASENNQVAINQPDDDGNILNDVGVGDYVCHIGHAPAGGTMMQMQFETLARLRGDLGVAIPDHLMLEYIDLPRKRELVEFLKNSQGYGEPSEQEAQLQSLQVEHAISKLKREIELMDAELDEKRAKTAELMAKASSLDGYNQAQIELQKLEQDRETKQQELQLRIALAARSHQNQINLNDKRLATQLAMKTLDHAKPEKPGNNPTR